MNRPDTPALKRTRFCLRLLLDRQPFFAALALRLPIEEDASRETLASDGETLRINPEWVEAAPTLKIQSAIAHVVTALSLKHHTRRGDRDYERWQEASRRVTLPILIDARLSWPSPDGLDMSVEEAYDVIDAPPPPPPPPAPPQGGQEGAAEGQEDPSGASGSGEGDEAASGDDNAPGEGEGDAPSYDPKGAGEVMDAPVEGTRAEQTEARLAIEREWDEAMHQACAVAKAAGRMPGALAARIESAHVRPMPWREILQQFIRSTARSDYSWARPNRRFIGQGVHLPALHSEGMGPIALIIDTSGSMDQRALAEVWGQIRAVAEDIRPESITVIECDAEVTGITTHHDVAALPERVGVRGGGGTRFGPALDALNRLERRPDCAIYFTDGGTSEDGSPLAEPDCPVLWALTDPGWTPWFGDAIHVTRRHP